MRNCSINVSADANTVASTIREKLVWVGRGRAVWQEPTSNIGIALVRWHLHLPTNIHQALERLGVFQDFTLEFVYPPRG